MNARDVCYILGLVFYFGGLLLVNFLAENELMYMFGISAGIMITLIITVRRERRLRRLEKNET